jgi:hypothetical protein
VEQSAILVRDAVVELLFECGQKEPLLFFPCGPNLPEGLQAVSRRDESLIASDREQGQEVMQHSIRSIALGEIA